MPSSANVPSFRLDIAGFGALDVLSFSGSEAISQVYGFDLHVRCAHPSENLSGLLFRAAHMLLGQSEEGIHGVILVVEAQAVRGDWRLHLGPRLACLAWRRQPRIFQAMSVVQILAHVLDEHGIDEAARRFELSASQPTQAYCVQHGESDLEFVQRLCASAGLRYHFQHARRGHLLVFSDSRGRQRRTARGFYRPTCAAPGVHAFSVQVSSAQELRPKARSGQLAQGESDLMGLRCGALLPLSAHPRREWNHLWLLTQVEHHGERYGYYNRFQAVAWEVLPALVKARPAPSLPGLYRARIVGPQPGREYRDEVGRIAVRFDMLASPTLCWLAVSPQLLSGLAGSTRGLVAESTVLVRFVRGDPQHPLIVACLEPVWPAVARAPMAVVADNHRLRIQVQRSELLGPAREIQLVGGPRLRFEPGTRMQFGVGKSRVCFINEALEFSSPTLAFKACVPVSGVAPARVDTRLSPQGRADILALLRAGHPLILLCRKPGGGSFSHCRDPLCACRAAANRDPRGEP